MKRLGLEEAVWRGGHILMIFSDKGASRKFLELADIKIYWHSECLATGKAKMFCTDQVISERVMLDVYEIFGGDNSSKPESIEIKMGDTTIVVPVARATKGEEKRGFVST
jgi:hypothetical protein